MDNEEFQRLVLNGFKEINDRFNSIDERFNGIDSKLREHDLQFSEIKSELADLKILSNQHHEELEKVARQVQISLQTTEQLIEIDNEHLAKRCALLKQIV